jgi:CBS domain-containing protein
MNAHDIMTTAIVTVRPDTPILQIARLLQANGISAVPVIDEGGSPVGMVSEGDLIGRDDRDREARRDWWLTLLAEGEALSGEFLANLHGPHRTARDVMAAPVITVSEDTDVGEIARLLRDYRIKRVPVIHDGRIVGIVSRADLVRVLADEQPAPTAPRREGLIGGALARLDEHFLHGRPESHQPAEPRLNPDDGAPTAGDFQHLMADFDGKELQHRREGRRAAAEQHQHLVAELIDHHVSDGSWQSLLHQARAAAERGQKELMLLHFPSQLCSDGGRAINAIELGWPATLRGEAAELYLRWERDLAPQGFHLTARVLEFPDGKPGEIGMFLFWGRPA